MGERPAYLAEATPAALEQRYVEREVIYLLGTLDTNPEHPALDKSCMAEAQGPYRYARGHSSRRDGKARSWHVQSQSVGRRRRRP
jgi:hypothetical protein